MPIASSYTCRICAASITDPGHVYSQWCPGCEMFGWEVRYVHPKTREHVLPDPVRLNLVFAEILNGLKVPFGAQTSFELGIERITDPQDGVIRFRAFFKVDGRVRQHSRRMQHDPQDALHELHLLCTGTDPEDV